MRDDHREDIVRIFSAALAAVDPFAAVRRAVVLSGDVLSVSGRTYDLSRYDRILAVGAGKATARMARAVEEILGDRLTGGAVVVKYGHAAPLRNIRQFEAAHPVPDEAGVEGTRRIVGLLQEADERALVLCLLSGGGSALLVAPGRGVSLADKQRTTELLLRAGADIGELNAVRKHLSAIKGGRLAQIACRPAIVTLLVSDVIGDRLDVISSGPTVPDRSTFGGALAVIEKYRLQAQVPKRALSFLMRGREGREAETPKEGDPCFRNKAEVIIAGLGQALTAAGEEARGRGYRARTITAELAGEARAAARLLAGQALEAREQLAGGERLCLLSGGETTVTVRGSGKGGRNQELALAFALEIEGTKGITFLSAGTDGTDGPTDAAGAVVDGETAAQARTAGLDPVASVENNDSYSFFQKLDSLTGSRSHLVTGPTGTNVMDMQVVLIGP
jgi:hydroxypyruvate reductase